MVPDDSSADEDTLTDEDTSTDDVTPDPADPSVRPADSGGILSPGDDTPAALTEILLYGVLGGIVGSVLSFIPFATVLGGAAAGYFCGGSSADALKTGAVAGVVMTLPFVAVVVFILFLLGFGGGPAAFGVIALLVVGLGAAYTLGSGVIGGYLGHYVRGKL